MTIIYAGRYARLSPWSGPFELRGKYCKVIEPARQLPPDIVAVEVHEVSGIWSAEVPRDMIHALSPAQDDLIRKHGSPAEFAAAVWQAGAELTASEINNGIADYVREFADAT